MTTLLLVRHGETQWNRDHRWQGYTGPPLNEEGQRQAVELAAKLEDIDAIYSSDSERAIQTAEVAGERLGLTVATDARLREVNFGEWEGLTRQEIDARYDGAFARWEACERPLPAWVEPDELMAERVIAALRDIVAAHPDGRILVVTSGGPIRAVQAQIAGLDQVYARRSLVTVRNCAVVEVIGRESVFEAATPS